MGFNADGFYKADFKFREERLELPALKEWFAEGEAPAFIVRGLSASELARCEDSKARSRAIGAIMEAVSQPGPQAEQIAELRRTLGLSDDTPAETRKRVEMLTYGSVEPKLDQTVVVKLAETFPIEFYMLTNLITKLTGQGAESQGKSKPSGEMETSEPQ